MSQASECSAWPSAAACTHAPAAPSARMPPRAYAPPGGTAASSAVSGARFLQGFVVRVGVTHLVSQHSTAHVSST